jgi:hypothetical protein
MAELTELQIGLAAHAGAIAVGAKFVDGEYARKIYRAAAPYLQLQLVNASTEEINSILATYRNSLRVNGGNERDAITTAVGWLIAARNAALLPKPVDPRLEKIRSALVYHAAHRFNQLITPNQFDEAALAVLTALNEVK